MPLTWGRVDGSAETRSGVPRIEVDQISTMIAPDSVPPAIQPSTLTENNLAENNLAAADPDREHIYVLGDIAHNRGGCI